MVDVYTRIVLTVIAACLVALTVQNIHVVRPAWAFDGPVHVVIDSVNTAWSGGPPVHFVCDNCR